jgi:hypothetical protein
VIEINGYGTTSWETDNSALASLKFKVAGQIAGQMTGQVTGTSHMFILSFALVQDITSLRRLLANVLLLIWVLPCDTGDFWHWQRCSVRGWQEGC